MKHISTFGLLTVLAVVLVASSKVLSQESKEKESARIPLESATLLEKLANYEAEQEKLFKVRRADAIVLLKQHLKIESDAGNLESAIAVKKAIAVLSVGVEQKAQISLPDLPQRSQQVLGALQESEGRIAKDFAQRITAKREAVFKILVEHVRRATKEGRVKESENLKKKVTKMRGTAPVMASLTAFPIEIKKTNTLGLGERRSFVKGLVMWEYPRTEAQSVAGGAFVPLNKLGKPSGKSRLVRSLNRWEFDVTGNAKAVGYLKIEKAGDYFFESNNGSDRNALYIDNMEKPLCPYGEGSGGAHKISLKEGMVPIVSVGYALSGGFCIVLWQPPGEKKLVEIPTALLYHTKEERSAP